MVNQEQIIQWAREAGCTSAGSSSFVIFNDELEAFAKLVAAHSASVEREALLDLVDDYAKNNADLKAAIRARGNT
jgi:hypothetical protein